MTFEGRNPDNTNRVLVQIRRMTETGDLPSQGRLPTERELCARLGAGRRAVRNALLALEAEGLIWRRQGKGTFLGQPPDPAGALVAEIAPEADPLTVMEARLHIEPGLAELCARRATGEDVERLQSLAERVVSSTDADSRELWDGALHRLIARIAGNRILLTAFTLLDEVRMNERWQHQRQRARSPGKLELYNRQHGTIIRAIETRDGPGARAAMTDHIRELSENLRASLAKETQ
ncbi:MAG: FCD domain-containing protein [Paracoccaceae bacterium]